MMERETYFPLLETIKWATVTATTAAGISCCSALWSGLVERNDTRGNSDAECTYYATGSDVGFPSNSFTKVPRKKEAN
jgi:hypothetical protein